MIVQVVQAVLVLPMRLLLEAIIIFWPSFRRSKIPRFNTVVEHGLHISLEILENFVTNTDQAVLELTDCANGAMVPSFQSSKNLRFSIVVQQFLLISL